MSQCIACIPSYVSYAVVSGSLHQGEMGERGGRRGGGGHLHMSFLFPIPIPLMLVPTSNCFYPTQTCPSTRIGRMGESNRSLHLRILIFHLCTPDGIMPVFDKPIHTSGTDIQSWRLESATNFLCKLSYFWNHTICIHNQSDWHGAL